MKLIFDFDDTIFDSQRFKKERVFSCLKNHGISQTKFQKSYIEYRNNNPIHNMREHLTTLIEKHNLKLTIETTVDEMTQNIDTYVSKEFIDIVRLYGKENICIISQGEENFQELKIKRSGVWDMVSKVIIVTDSKERGLYSLSEEYPKEIILFFDDKLKNLDLSKKNVHIIPFLVGDTTLLAKKELEHLKQSNINICQKGSLIKTISKYTQ